MPKKTINSPLVIILLSFLFGVFYYGCKPDSTVVSSGTPITNVTQKSIVSGQVINDITGIPIDSANVLITGPQINISLFTDIQGKYSTEITTDNNINITILVSKSGFITDTTSIIVTPSATISVPLVKVTPENSGTPPSGNPVSIFLASQSSFTIGVKESGSIETASLTFEVRDSSGTPIDLAHTVNVQFNITASPGGGEIISPTIVQTNNLGQATVNITSGTKAGVVQIKAQITVGTTTIVSNPVSISIEGGLPDLTHFSIIPSLLNFPGYDIFGITMSVGVNVGDKFSNPVKPNTIVTFNTTGGTIGGSLATNDQGGGSVTLTSGNPKPTDLTLGAGFATVTASTVDENNTTIIRQAVVLFSGIPQISISPTTFNIPNSGSQNFTYTVKDENGNPLAGGTTITVNVQGVSVIAQGQLSVGLPDTQSPFWTSFSFTVLDNIDSTNIAKPVTITINSVGPNGSGQAIITGTSN